MESFDGVFWVVFLTPDFFNDLLGKQVTVAQNRPAKVILKLLTLTACTRSSSGPPTNAATTTVLGLGLHVARKPSIPPALVKALAVGPFDPAVIMPVKLLASGMENGELSLEEAVAHVSSPAPPPPMALTKEPLAA